MKMTGSKTMSERIIVYTDGSVIDNGSEQSKCGWAVKLMYNGKAMLKSGKVRGYTNNQTEMYAVFKAMQSIHDKKVPVTIYSDSQYVIKTFNKEFQVGANEKMWKQLFDEASKFDDIQFVWVRGHSNDRHNIEVDELSFKEANDA